MRRLHEMVRRTRRRGHTVAAEQVTVPLFAFVSLTCVADGLDHVVTEVELSSPDATLSGRYLAVCGRTVLPAAMVEPNGKRCKDCRARTPGGARGSECSDDRRSATT